MTRGRRKKPDSLDDLHGNPGRRGKRNETLHVVPGKLGLPRGLSKTVQRHCSKMAKYLKENGAQLDFVRPLFERYCKHLQVSSDAHMDLRRLEHDPDEIIDYIKASGPLEKIFTRHSDAALRIEKQFEVILRNTKPPPKKKSPLEEFQERKIVGKLRAVK